MALAPIDDARPPFMASLGLLPPYTEADVKQAYLEKAKTAHPDRGGNAAAFHEIQTAFEQALHYVHIHKDRRGWIASQIDAYVSLQELVSSLAYHYGAEVGWDSPQWIEQSFGDFAHLIDRVVWIRLEKSRQADQMLAEIVRRHSDLRQLKRLELAGSHVSDASLLGLAAFSSLSYLDLRGTSVTSQMLSVIDKLPGLQSVELADTSVGWWSRYRIRTRLRRRQRRNLPKLALWLVGARPSPGPGAASGAERKTGQSG